MRHCWIMKCCGSNLVMKLFPPSLERWLCPPRVEGHLDCSHSEKGWPQCMWQLEGHQFVGHWWKVVHQENPHNWNLVYNLLVLVFFVFFMAIFPSPRYMYYVKWCYWTRAQKSVLTPYHHDCCSRLLGGSSYYGRFPPHWVSHCWRRRHVVRVGRRVGHSGASNALLF